MARVLANRLLLVIRDLVGPEQTYAVKGRSIQNNLHLIREVLEGIEDGTEAALISLDQSKAFDRVDHRFLATVLETAGFQPEFRRWITMMYHNLQAVVQVNGRRSRSSVWSSRAAPCPLFSMFSLWSPCSVGLGIRGRIRPRTVSLLLAFYGKGFHVRRWYHSVCNPPPGYKGVKKAVGEYELIAGAKVNFDKSEGWRLGAWRGSDTLLLEWRARPHPQGVVRARPPTNTQRRSGYAWSGEPVARWKTCILGPILDGGRIVETKGESDFSSLAVRPKGWRST